MKNKKEEIARLLKLNQADIKAKKEGKIIESAWVYKEKDDASIYNSSTKLVIAKFIRDKEIDKFLEEDDCIRDNAILEGNKMKNKKE